MAAPLPRKIYLIRHAQSEENVLALRDRISSQAFNEVLRRSPEAPLTQEGQRQAREVVAKLADARIGKLYSSPFARALTTATLLGDAIGLQPTVIDDLREVLPRERDERRSSHSLGSMFLRSYLELFWPWGEGEGWPTAYRRARSAWHAVSQEAVDEVAAVSHRALISLIVISLRRSRTWMVRVQDVSNGGISIIERKIM